MTTPPPRRASSKIQLESCIDHPDENEHGTYIDYSIAHFKYPRTHTSTKTFYKKTATITALKHICF